MSITMKGEYLFNIKSYISHIKATFGIIEDHHGLANFMWLENILFKVYSDARRALIDTAPSRDIGIFCLADVLLECLSHFSYNQHLFI